MTTKPTLAKIAKAVAEYEAAVNEWDTMYENGDIDPIRREVTWLAKEKFYTVAPEALKALLEVAGLTQKLMDALQYQTMDLDNDEHNVYMELKEALKALEE